MRLSGSHMLQLRYDALACAERGQQVKDNRIQRQTAEDFVKQPWQHTAPRAPAEAEYRPGTGVAQGKRSSKPKELSMWWMCPAVMPKWLANLGGVSVKVSATWVQSAAGLACRASVRGVSMPGKLQGTHALRPQAPCACNQESSDALQAYSMHVAVAPTAG